MPLQKLGTKQYYLGIFFKVSNTFTYVNRLLKTIHIKKCLGIKLSVVIPNEKKREKIRESQQQCCNFGLYRSGRSKMETFFFNSHSLNFLSKAKKNQNETLTLLVISKL